jgi:hypothetical protein
MSLSDLSRVDVPDLTWPEITESRNFASAISERARDSMPFCEKEIDSSKNQGYLSVFGESDSM